MGAKPASRAHGRSRLTQWSSRVVLTAVWLIVASSASPHPLPAAAPVVAEAVL